MTEFEKYRSNFDIELEELGYVGPRVWVEWCDNINYKQANQFIFDGFLSEQELNITAQKWFDKYYLPLFGEDIKIIK